MAIKLITDSTCDLPLEYINEHNITVLPFPVRFGDEEYLIGPDPASKDNMPVDEFFRRIGAGELANTSQIAIGDYTDAFAKASEDGSDVLYLAFSSGCSGTVNTARLAASEFPEGRIRVVDTLSESLGQGMVVTRAVEKLQAEPDISLEALAQYVENVRLYVRHWFTIDDLHYLARGGRLSNKSAVVGSLLHIKPLLDCNSEGRLVSREKHQGRKKVLRELLKKYMETRAEGNGPVYIGHGHCEEEAHALAEMIREKTGKIVDMIGSITPVISAHCGIGTIALFFLSKEPRTL